MVRAGMVAAFVVFIYYLRLWLACIIIVVIGVEICRYDILFKCSVYLFIIRIVHLFKIKFILKTLNLIL